MPGNPGPATASWSPRPWGPSPRRGAGRSSPWPRPRVARSPCRATARAHPGSPARHVACASSRTTSSTAASTASRLFSLASRAAARLRSASRRFSRPRCWPCEDSRRRSRSRPPRSGARARRRRSTTRPCDCACTTPKAVRPQKPDGPGSSLPPGTGADLRRGHAHRDNGEMSFSRHFRQIVSRSRRDTWSNHPGGTVRSCRRVSRSPSVYRPGTAAGRCSAFVQNCPQGINVGELPDLF